MKRKLIITADDFGLTYSVNKAVIDVFSAGNLTSATLMVNMPGVEDAVEMAKKNPKLSVGIHFCITEGKPISSCSSLIDEQGNFFNRATLIKRILMGQVNDADIRKELRAQIDKFRSFEIPLSHIDSHKHVHLIPFVFKNILPAVHSEELPVRIVDPVHIGFSLLSKRPVKFIKQMANRYLSRKLRTVFTEKINDRLVSIRDLGKIEITAETYYRLVNQAEPEDIVELMVHPYILGEDVLGLYENPTDTKMTFLKDCQKEYELLSQKKIFNESVYELITYQNL